MTTNTSRSTTGTVSVTGRCSYLPEPATDALDAVAAQELWETLALAREQSPVVGAAEDAVYRFYLPMASAIAGDSDSDSDSDCMPIDLVLQAAELGLAKAVLAWRRTDAAAFPAFARASILSQIRHADMIVGSGRWQAERTVVGWRSRTDRPA